MTGLEWCLGKVLKSSLEGVPRLNPLELENRAVLTGGLACRGRSSEGAEVRLGLGQGCGEQGEAPPECEEEAQRAPGTCGWAEARTARQGGQKGGGGLQRWQPWGSHLDSALLPRASAAEAGAWPARPGPETTCTLREGRCALWLQTEDLPLGLELCNRGLNLGLKKVRSVLKVTQLARDRARTQTFLIPQPDLSSLCQKSRATGTQQAWSLGPQLGLRLGQCRTRAGGQNHGHSGDKTRPGPGVRGAQAGTTGFLGSVQPARDSVPGLVVGPAGAPHSLTRSILCPPDLPPQGEELAWPFSWRRLQLLLQPGSQQTKALSFPTQSLPCVLL